MKMWAKVTALLALLSFGLCVNYGFAQSEVVESAVLESDITQSEVIQSDVHVTLEHYERPSAEQLRALPGETWSARVDGLKLRYHLVSLEGFSSLGYFVFSKGTCHIYIDSWLARHASRAEHLSVVFHEVGHCVDAAKLRFTHNSFVHEGCVYGAYYCAPAEGYAEAWRYAYAARCGLDAAAIGYESVLSALGYSVRTPLKKCTLPTAEGVLPPFFAKQRTKQFATYALDE